MKIKLIRLLMIAAVALVGCGKQEQTYTSTRTSKTASLIAQKRKEIPVKLTPEQVTQFFEDVLIGEWTAIDKDTKEVVEKGTCHWKKKGESVTGEGVTFENGKIKDHYTFVTSYDPKLGLFVQQIDEAITRHIHWDPKQKIGTGEKISPKLPPGVEMKLNWKITGPNRQEAKFEF